jgi:hypothetical protein
MHFALWGVMVSLGPATGDVLMSLFLLVAARIFHKVAIFAFVINKYIKLQTGDSLSGLSP